MVLSIFPDCECAFVEDGGVVSTVSEVKSGWVTYREKGKVNKLLREKYIQKSAVQVISVAEELAGMQCFCE